MLSPYRVHKPPVGSRIDRSHPLAQGLIAAYLLDPIGRAFDIVGGPFGPMILSGTIQGKNGRFGQMAPYFSSATPGYTSAGSVALGGTYSWVIWFRADAAVSGATTGQPIHQTTQETIGFSWTHGSGAFQQAIWHRTAAGSYVPVKIVSALAADTWYQIGATYDLTNARVYLNGKLEATAACAAGSASAFTLELMRPASGQPGSIDHFLFWKDRALTSSDMMALYVEPFAMLRGRRRL